MAPRFVKRRRTVNLLGWPTDVVTVDPKLDHGDDTLLHTIIVWVPGNPGQHDWYHFDFVALLSGLGPGYCIRSLSHAGHGLKANRTSNGGDDHDNSHLEDQPSPFRIDQDETRSASPLISWTVEGQVLHKIAFIDSLLSSTTEESRHKENNNQRVCRFETNPRFIFVGHSFGCHVVQRMCVLRSDILERTTGFLFLMPYIRTNPALSTERKKLNFGGCYPEYLISLGTKVSRTLRFIPEDVVRGLIRKGLQGDSNENEDGNSDAESIANVTSKILRDPLFPRYFFELGTEEIRDIPNEIDTTALRLLSSRKPVLFQGATPEDTEFQAGASQRRLICILYADDDQWCPTVHGEEIGVLQSNNMLPLSIERTKISGLRHDYVCQNQATRSEVYDWCISKIVRMNDSVRGKQTNSSPRTTNKQMLSSKL
mmetsp:Transcript_22476/g.53048  ORF Transcript_22476/g.53048 Transcript_22476/m.53048 type:complete len:426 (+) Transcript_22476:95-1372(+)